MLPVYVENTLPGFVFLRVRNNAKSDYYLCHVKSAQNNTAPAGIVTCVWYLSVSRKSVLKIHVLLKSY
jgi:hypothetical protein